MEGFFPHLSQGSPEVFFYAGKNRHRWWDKKEKVQSDCKEAKDMGYDLEEPVGLKWRTVEAEKYPSSRI